MSHRTFPHGLMTGQWHCPGLWDRRVTSGLNVLPPRWAVFCAPKRMPWGLSSQGGSGNPSLLLSSIPVCFQMRKSVSSHRAATTMLLEPNTAQTVTCSDPWNGFPAQVTTKPKMLSSTNPPYFSLPPLPLRAPTTMAFSLFLSTSSTALLQDLPTCCPLPPQHSSSRYLFHFTLFKGPSYPK